MYIWGMDVTVNELKDIKSGYEDKAAAYLQKMIDAFTEETGVSIDNVEVSITKFLIEGLENPISFSVRVKIKTDL